MRSRFSSSGELAQLASTDPVIKEFPVGGGVGELTGGDGQFSSSTAVMALALDVVWV